MRPFQSTISLDEARALINQHVVPVRRTVRVALGEARDRVLAAAVIAPGDVPPFDRAAMDGYAVVAADTHDATRDHPRPLKRTEAVQSGALPTRPVTPGECIEIATGAPMPDGADAVVMVENTRGNGDTIQVLAPVQPGQHVGRHGSDITQGHTILREGDHLTPRRLGALAAIGCASVEVFERPSVAIMATGNEVVAPGTPLKPGQVHDINGVTLSAIVAEHGGAPVRHAIVADSLGALDEAVDRATAAPCDILVFSGGSSVGNHDLVSDIIARRGTLVFHGIAVKPGKPTAFGLIGETPVFGMPGYPASCLSNAYVLLVPLLRQVACLPAYRHRTVVARSAQRIVSPADRHQFYSVRVEHGEAVSAFKASGDITSLSQADGFIEIPERTEVVEEGAMVEVTLF